MLTQSANSQPNNNGNNADNTAKNDSYVNAYVPPQTGVQQQPQQQSRPQFQQHPKSQQHPQKQSRPIFTTDGRIAGGETTQPELKQAKPAVRTSPQILRSVQNSTQTKAPIPTLPPIQAVQPNFASGDAPSPAKMTDKAKSEVIEDQNIFQLLGVNDGTDEEKERFLDELQEVIWEDFLETDLELLVTEEEHAKVKEILAQTNKNDQELQDETIQFLEKLIPDLEEIMLEKALELKEDMVRERIAGMREFYAGNTSALGQLSEAEKLLTEDKWYSATQKLNGVG